MNNGFYREKFKSRRQIIKYSDKNNINTQLSF